MNYTIITDTSANIPSATAKENNICVIPFSFYIDGKENFCLNTTDFNAKEFYDLMRAGNTVKTSQINPQRYIDVFEPILEGGSDILFIGMSSGISGSFNSAVMATNQLKEKYVEREILLVDTLGASLGEGLIVLKANQYKAEGKTIHENATTLAKDVRCMYQVFTVNDLEYLRKGGRLSNAEALLGRILGIKPLLKGNENGKIVSFGKTVGRKKVIELLAKKYSDYVISPEKQTVGISHADCYDDAQALASLISYDKKPKDILIVDHEPVTGSYLGPGSLALYFFGEEDVRLK